MTQIILENFSILCRNRLEILFERYLSHSISLKLQKAIHYSVLNGGKRIRPLLVYAVGKSLDATWDNLDGPACAIELIHAYSLIHDDLPAMDNADFRRGQPSCHKAFDEAIAILAGDALQPLAFEILATHSCTLTAEQRIHMIDILSKASGMNGMVAGQAIDLVGVHSIENLNHMYQLKTGALLEGSVRLAIIASGIQDIQIVNALENYIENISLAFQIQDDLLDVKEYSNTSGKPQGLDETNKKITYPSLLGIEKTEILVEKLFGTALSAIEIMGDKATLLFELAHYLMKRKN